ncbi:ATP-dependent DNA helicase [Nesterenkonia sp. LY-0111]|uniref:DNA 3'-5' helicase n=2 Tax=Nesterenkonia aerolata TaxID=3074079 RepID=A0ABU2DP59_9MICC|nr:ATP-dependent DNA helicase [Nesterenkonia sp. LY-0111]
MTTTSSVPGAPDMRKYSAHDLLELLHDPLEGSFKLPTAEQTPVIEHGLDPLLVVAGAGSGKTATMADRVVYQVAIGAVKPDEVLGVTFTKKAASELRERMIGKLKRLEERRVIAVSDLLGADEAGISGVGIDGVMDLLAPEVSTYHSYAHALVQEYGLQIGLEPETRVITEAEAWQIITAVVRDYASAHREELIELDVSISTLANHALTLASECAEHLIDDPEEVRRFLTAEIDYPETLAMDQEKVRGAKKAFTVKDRELLTNLAVRRHVVDVVEAYQQRKRMRQVMDYGDLLVNAVRIVRETDAAAQQRSKYRLVLLDEFQDTSHAQLELFTALFAHSEGPGVTAVGDPNQSIYGFRGASAGQLFSFVDRFTRQDADSGEWCAPRTLQLTKAWRNGTVILDAANRLVAPLREKQGRTAPDWKRYKQDEKRISALTAGKTEPGELRCGWFPSDDEEFAAVADRIAAELAAASAEPAGAGEPSSGAGSPPPTAAVLSRTRKHLMGIARELDARAVAYEFVGLSGLLEVPEVADVIAYLRVISDASRGDAMLRLLAGPKYQIGPRDLMQLNRLAARTLMARQPVEAETAPAEEPVKEAAELASLVEGLFAVPADPRDPQAEAFTTDGHQRLVRAKQDLRILGRLAGLDIPTLLERVIEVTGLGVEVLVRPGDSQHLARRQLDALLDHARGFASAAAESSDVEGFLAWLDAAEERERGLGLAAAEPRPGAVQLLTVHASKGLEWDIVAVIGLREGIFPSDASDRWTGSNGALPWPLRGDRESLPQWESRQEASVAFWSAALGVASAGQTKRWRESVRARRGFDEDAPVLTFAEQVTMFRREEERRLAYVAVTRAERLLLVTGARFYGATKTGQIPSQFLRELAAVEGVKPFIVRDPASGEDREMSLPSEVSSPDIETSEDEELFAEVKDFRQEPNPKASQLWEGVWPFDPLAQTPLRLVTEERYEKEPWRVPVRRPMGEDSPVVSRRPAVEAAASRVHGLMAGEGTGCSSHGGADESDRRRHPGGGAAEQTQVSDVEQEAQWAVDRFLASRMPLGAPELPAIMSTSRFVELDADGQEVAERYRRPVPKQPSTVMRRGTAVHGFIEDYYGHRAGLDGIEDPLQGDQHVSREFGIEKVRASVETSPWGARQIAAMEIGLMTSVDGVTINGRIDAVFGVKPDGTDVEVSDFDRWQGLPRGERHAAMAQCSWQLVDWKTGKVPHDLENKQLQLAIYRLAFSRTFGVALEDISAAFYYIDHARVVQAEHLPEADQLEEVIRRARRFFA